VTDDGDDENASRNNGGEGGCVAIDDDVEVVVLLTTGDFTETDFAQWNNAIDNCNRINAVMIARRDCPSPLLFIVNFFSRICVKKNPYFVYLFDARSSSDCPILNL